MQAYLRASGLPEAWAGRERFVVLDTAFGAGGTFLATWQEWRRDPRRCARLHYVALHPRPFALPEAAAELHAQWPLLVPGTHRIELDGGKVVLTLHFSDTKVLRELRLAADAIYLHAGMGAAHTLRSISRLAARGATLATSSTDPAVCHALEETGFAVEKRDAMLVARNTRAVEDIRVREKRAAVIGAGLAGAAVCERLCSRGWEVDLYERHARAAEEASGNHAGTFHPVATPDDSVFARMTRAAALYSATRWRALEGVRWDPCGVLQLARDEKEAASQARAAALFPPEYAQHVSRDEASRHAGIPVAAGGLWFSGGGWLQPRTLISAQLAACGSRLRTHYGTSIHRRPEAPVVILANSAEAAQLCDVPHLRLRRVRGQLTYVPAERLEPPHVVVLRGGMVLPPVDGLCVVGASYDIDDESAELREESHAGNLERLERIILQRPQGAFDGRVAFRSVAPDRLPVVGRIEEGLYGAFAFGSRGLICAALAAELIASQLEGEPLPVEGSLASALDPLRFRRRAESRGSRP